MKESIKTSWNCTRAARSSSDETSKTSSPSSLTVKKHGKCSSSPKSKRSSEKSGSVAIERKRGEPFSALQKLTEVKELERSPPIDCSINEPLQLWRWNQHS